MNAPEIRWMRGAMATRHKVNLEALIIRQDLEAGALGSGQAKEGDILVSELAISRVHYELLRKPDFQRETDDWDIDNVVTLIKSFRDGDLIPALIMWRAEQGLHYVIDGAHRLSALIAWVNDDYGDLHISNKFFGYRLSEQQKRTAVECRRRVAAEVGTYADLTNLQRPNRTPQHQLWASNISTPLKTQWVTGNAATAEKSFIAINQRAVQINETEKYMIEARRKPNVISARALIRCATGHEYWAKFPESAKESIREKAKRVFDVLFEPENAELLQTIEMPVAGKAYSAESLRLTLELINSSNDLISAKALSDLEDDANGDKTVRFLDRTLGIVKYLSGENVASLGLHPAVYFWGPTGNHYPSAFLAVISFIRYLSPNNGLMTFSAHRARFEEFLVSRPTIVKHVLGAYGGWRKSSPTVFEMFKLILAGCVSGASDDEIEESILSDDRFRNLGDLVQLDRRPGKRPSRETKVSIRRKALLAAAVRCTICWARLPSTSFSDDHDIRQDDGGLGDEKNMGLTHHFCNHGFKEHLTSRGEALPPKPEWLP